MNLVAAQNGDAVYALTTITNDGGVPGAETDEVFARPGDMGMLINTGYVEEEPDTTLYLVSFRNADGELGPPVTCLEDEISITPPS